MPRVAHHDVGRAAALGTQHDRSRSRAAGFVDPASITPFDITQGPHAVKAALPEFHGLPLGSVPPRPELEEALAFYINRANVAQWGLDPAADYRDLPAPNGQQAHDAGLIPLRGDARLHIAHARAVRAALRHLDNEAGAQAAEERHSKERARSEAQQVLSTYRAQLVPLSDAAEPDGIEEARAFLAKIDNARRAVKEADAARAKLEALWRSACEAALLLGKEPPPAPVEGMAA